MSKVNRKDSKGRVLKTGERERKDGTYEYRYKDTDGLRKSIYADNLNELRKKAKDIHKDIDNGVIAGGKKPTLIEVYQMYLDGKSFARALGTNKTYEKKLKMVNNTFLAKKRIDALTETDVRRLIKEWNERYSRDTIRLVLSDLNSSMKQAIRDNIISRNPFDFNWGDIVTDKKKEVVALTDTQWERIVSIIQATKARRWLLPHLIIMKETGLRISEYVALNIKNVDFENRLLTVKYQFNIEPRADEIHIAPLKTKSSYGKIPLTKEAIAALQELVRRCPATRTIDGEDGFFIIGPRGTGILRPTTVRQSLKAVEEMYNALYPEEPIHLHPHVLRHTAATNFIRKGLSPSSVQKIMRHSTPTITLRIYTNIMENDVRNELDRLDL